MTRKQKTILIVILTTILIMISCTVTYKKTSYFKIEKTKPHHHNIPIDTAYLDSLWSTRPLDSIPN
jgi:hypothetical protein